MSAPDDFFSCDYFTLFQTPPTLAVDENALAAAYRALQGRAHPDRFAGGTEAEKQLASQMASRINDAYRTLREALPRAAYLLSLRGVDVYQETDTALPPDFLEQQMTWREELMENADDAEKMATLQAAVEQQQTAIIAETETAMQAEDWEAAYQAVRRWIYTDKLLKDLRRL